MVENPKAYASRILANYQLNFFSKQLPADDFIVVGDDKGLFIIVPENRVWYPTDVRSARHWGRVTIEWAGGIAEITLNA